MRSTPKVRTQGQRRGGGGEGYNYTVLYIVERNSNDIVSRKPPNSRPNSTDGQRASMYSTSSSALLIPVDNSNKTNREKGERERGGTTRKSIDSARDCVIPGGSIRRRGLASRRWSGLDCGTGCRAVRNGRAAVGHLWRPCGSSLQKRKIFRKQFIAIGRDRCVCSPS